MKSVGKANLTTPGAEGLPIGWRWSTLGELSQVNPPRANPNSEEAEVSFLAMGDVSEDGRIRNLQARRYSDVAKGFTSFIDDDVLVAKITPCFENGKGALVGGLLNGLGFGSTEFHVVRARHELALPAFLHLHTRTETFRALGERSMVGSAGQKRVPAEFLRAYPVALPPVLEQERIAAILTAVDDKLDVIARQIEAAQTLKQGLMQTLFSRGVGTADASGRWLPHREFQSSEMGEVPATWRMSTLGECSKVIYRYPGFYGFEPLSEGVPVVRGEHIKNGRLSTEWSNYWYVTDKDSEDFPKTVLEEGDIVMAVRGTVGNFAIVGPEHIGAQISPNLIRISPDHKIVDRTFFYFQMDLSATLLKKSFVQSQALPSLSAADIKRIAMPIPPIQEQRKIGEILGAVETKLAALSAKQSVFKQLKQGLMQKLLTGEWRVKVDADMAA